MHKRKVSRDDGGRAIIAGFTREDFERLNRLDHAKNLRCIIRGTKWLNYCSSRLRCPMQAARYLLVHGFSDSGLSMTVSFGLSPLGFSIVTSGKSIDGTT